MSLNDYQEEAKEFMRKINDSGKNTEQKLAWLEEEFQLLKDAVSKAEEDKIRHQIYDMLFLLFEIGADYEFDLDNEWTMGRIRKQEKYLSN